MCGVGASTGIRWGRGEIEGVSHLRHKFRLYICLHCTVFPDLPMAATGMRGDFQAQPLGAGVNPRLVFERTVALQAPAYFAAELFVLASRFNPLAPIRWPENQPFAEHQGEPAISHRAAAPRPFFGAGGQARVQWVGFNIPQNQRQAPIFRHGKALESSME
jgi:hypothetical protein